MSALKANRSIPSATVIPVLIYPDVREAVEWLCVAFEFPDYHKVTDSWEKLDYENMATVDRAVAFGMLKLASPVPPPRWNESYAPAKKYVEAAQKLRP